MKKQFKLAADEIKPLVGGYGACIASDMITVEGYPVRFMYRESPCDGVDSGWRFFSGFEDDQYMNNSDNHAFYDVNTVANYDPSIIAHLDSPIGSAFEKTTGAERFVPVSDWEPPVDE
jgi:hypothetical protein